ncbi:HD domain-containing protein [Marinomonas gallaica]|uniref:HD domain-containing protein n=1 Tax=Marinomonas gallaica TaxID=1806667 RepID=UPI003A8E75B3
MRESNELERHCKAYIVERMQTDNAHDLAHIERVVKQAKRLAQEVGAESTLVIAAAWLHDVVNYPKDHPKRSQASFDSASLVEPFLKNLGFDHSQVCAIQHAIITHSFSAQVTPRTLEAQVVQDADRLDALGAIGIARCMMVGGQFSRLLYELEDPFCSEREPNDLEFTLDHFYQKLLRLEATFQTHAGRAEAARRTQFMRKYLEQLRFEIS